MVRNGHEVGRRPVRLLLGATAALIVAGPLLRYVDGQVASDDSRARFALAYAAGAFDLGGEGNVPTWFTTLALAAVAGLLVLHARLAPARSTRRASGVLAVVALLLSLDEAAELHEELARVGSRGLAGLSGLPTFAWVVPGAVLALAVGAVLLLLARALPGLLRRRLVVAGSVYLFGALVAEAASGALLSSGQGYTSAAYLLANAVEEGAEMVGALLAVRALLGQLAVRRTPTGLLLTTLPRAAGDAVAPQPSAVPDHPWLVAESVDSAS